MNDKALNDRKSFILKWFDERSVRKNTSQTLNDLNRAIRELSAKLYSTKTHFLLELIQNADDNTYTPDCVPELTFLLKTISLDGAERMCLCVYNNEVGFSEKNLEALFQIANSTKTKKDGFIGEKGIGFKSVFSVTDSPYIYSSGYQFKLPEKVHMGQNTELGYIVPIWVDDKPKFVSAGTHIILPLTKISEDDISTELEEISAEIILFLKKLNKISIIIENDSEMTERTIYKEYNPATHTVILHDKLTKNGRCEENQCEFLFRMKTIKKPLHLIVEERLDITERDLTIAIPLNDKNYPGKIFAYLPVKEGTGLPFLINADFLLASSRESISKNKWNEWIWSEIPRFFADIVEEIMCDAKTSIYTKFSIFKRIPVKALEAQLQIVVDEIYRELQSTKCLLSYEDYEPLAPRECKRVSREIKKFLEAVNWEPDLDDPFCLLANELEDSLEILRRLEVERVSSSEILSLLSDDFIENLDDNGFIELYLFLLQEKITCAHKYSWVPVSNSENKPFMVGGRSEVIYHPVNDSNGERSGCTYLKKEYVKIFFLRSSLFDAIRKRTEAEVILKFLDKMWGVKSFSLGNYCASLKQLLSKDFPADDKDFLEISEFITKNKMPPDIFLTNKGRQTSSGKSIVVNPDFFKEGKSWDLIWCTPEDQAHFSFLCGYTKETQKNLLDLGKVYLYPTFRVLCDNSCNVLPQMARHLFYSAMRCAAMSRSYETHVTFPVVPSGMTEARMPMLANVLITLLNYYVHVFSISTSSYSYGDTQIKCGLICRAEYQNRGIGFKEGDSDVIALLKNTAWIPTNQGLKCPSAVWVDSPTIKQIFKGTAPVLQANIPKQLYDILGIKSELTSEALVDQLGSLSANNENIGLEYAKVLYATCKQFDVRIFGDKRFFFVPGTQKLWYRNTECLWEDESAVLGNTFQYLSKHYKNSELKEYFLKQGIQETSTITTYMNLWLSYQKNNETLSFDLVDKLYKKLIRNYQDPVTLKQWKEFLEHAKLITATGTFRHPVAFLFADNSTFENIFVDDARVIFAYIAESSHSPLKRWRDFYNEFSVKTLSSCVSTSIPSKTIDTANALEKNLIITPQFIIMLATWLYEHAGEKAFARDYKSKLDALQHIKEYDMTSKFDLLYKLDHPNNFIITKIAKVSAHYDARMGCVFAHRTSNDWKRILALEIASFIGSGNLLNDFENFVELTLGEQTLDRIAEKKWSIPPGFETPSESKGKETEILEYRQDTKNAEEKSANQESPAARESIVQKHETQQQNSSDAKNNDHQATKSEKPLNESSPAFSSSQKQYSSSQKQNTASDTNNIKKNDTTSHVANSEEEKNTNTSTQNVRFSSPDYKAALDEKFSRTADNTIPASNEDDEEEDYEPLTDAMRERRTARVKQDLKNRQREAEKEALEKTTGTRNDAVRKEKSKPSSKNISKTQNDIHSWHAVFSDKALSEEEKKVILSFMKDDPCTAANVLFAVVHRKDPAVRKDLEEHYHGKCQICRKTWRMANGQPFWIAAYLLPLGKGGVSHSGNAICLCAEHFAKWLHGTIAIENNSFTSIINAIPENCNKPELHFKLAGEDVVLRYSPRHFCDLKATLEFYAEEVQADKEERAAEINMPPKETKKTQVLRSLADLNSLDFS